MLRALGLCKEVKRRESSGFVVTLTGLDGVLAYAGVRKQRKRKAVMWMRKYDMEEEGND